MNFGILVSILLLVLVSGCSNENRSNFQTINENITLEDYGAKFPPWKFVNWGVNHYLIFEDNFGTDWDVNNNLGNNIQGIRFGTRNDAGANINYFYQWGEVKLERQLIDQDGTIQPKEYLILTNIVIDPVDIEDKEFYKEGVSTPLNWIKQANILSYDLEYKIQKSRR